MKNNNNTTFINLTKTQTPTLTDPGLWHRIQARHAGLAADLAFVGRLRAEGALNEPDPKPLLLEYLRFAYLAWTNPAGTTPSRTVDEVWHAHILFTRSYAAFCEATRGAVLHHDPGGGEADDGRFQAAYRRTLSRYAAEFGEPPGRYWPRPAGPPEEIPKPEPPRAVPKSPPPAPAERGSRPSLEPVLVLGLLAGIATFLVTTSAPAAFMSGLLGGSLGILIAASRGSGSPRPANRPPPRPAQTRPTPTPRPARPSRPSSAARRSGTSSSTTSSGDGGAIPAALWVNDAPASGSHGHSGHSGGHGGGDGGGSSCSGGSSCGGGGCGGG